MLDYQSGRLLYRHPQENIEVRQNEHYRWLHFDSPSIQSAMSLTKPHSLALSYMPIMQKITDFVQQPESILLLGLGGGGFIRYLHHRYPQCHIDVVEISSTVIEIAQRYFNIPSDSNNLNIINTDAAEILHNCKQNYDIIYVDLYQQDSMPDFMYSTDFYIDVHHCLKANATTAINLVCPRLQDFQTIITIVREVFQQRTMVLPTADSYNIILFAFDNDDYKKTVNRWLDEKILKSAKYDLQWGLIAELV